MQKRRFAGRSPLLGLERLEDRNLLAVSIVPQAQTAAVSGAADDIAIWIHPTDPSKSTIIGSIKTSANSLHVYNLAGQELQSVAVPKVNNVDLRYNFSLGGQNVALVTGSNRSNNSIVVYAVDPNTGRLHDVAARTISTGMIPYGLAMYASPVTGKLYTIITSETGQIQQWELFDNGAGKVDAKLVRSLNIGSRSEGLVADDVTGSFYVSEETVGIWRYSAEPDGGTTRTLVDSTGTTGHLKADVEGLTIYYAPDGAGYLLASSQGSNDFAVFRRDGNNAYVGRFNLIAGGGIDAVTITDGIDVTNFPLGSQYPHGLFVAQDNDTNFKLVGWDAIASALGGLLTSDATWDPRLVGAGSGSSGGDSDSGGGAPINQAPHVSAGADQTIAFGSAIALDGTATDDGLPALPGTLNIQWSQISGPGTVDFDNAQATDTAATFSAPGDYVLRMTVSDGELAASDEVTVHANQSSPPQSDTLTQTAVFQDGVGYSGTRDTMLRGDKTTSNGGKVSKIKLDGTPDEAMLISWNVRSIPDTAIVDSAQIDLYVTSASLDSYPVYALQRPWDEFQATWQLAQAGKSWATAGAQDATDYSTQIGTLKASSKGVATIVLNEAGVALVQSWIANPEGNYGIIIQNYATATDNLVVASRESSKVASRPRLTIDFSLPAVTTTSTLSTLVTATEPTPDSNTVETGSTPNADTLSTNETSMANTSQEAALLAFLDSQSLPSSQSTETSEQSSIESSPSNVAPDASLDSSLQSLDSAFSAI
jgi:3-phytase